MKKTFSEIILTKACYKKEERLLKSFEFKKVLREGEKIRAKGFLCFVLKNDKRKIGISVSSKVANSVNRNKIKRFIREVFRNNKKDFPNASIFISVKEAGVFSSYKKTETVLLTHLKSL